MIEMRFSRVLQRPGNFYRICFNIFGLGWVVGAITITFINLRENLS